MNTTLIKQQLAEKGYCIVPNVLSSQDVKLCKQKFKDWQKTIPKHDKIHEAINPHGIYKYHRAGHTWHAWYIRTRPQVQDIFKALWNTDELVVSFDGCCYISKNSIRRDNCWTHTDQAPSADGLRCYQGFVALTENKERTLIVYEGTHKIHKQYFENKGIKSSKNWQLIDRKDLPAMKDKRRIMHIPAGALVLWDSRVFHQNQYGKPNSEERLIQYVCYLPKNHEKNTTTMIKKRAKYFKERRTTSHWPCPITVNSLQPNTWGDDSKKIDYEKIPVPDLSDLAEDIVKLIV